MRGSATILIGIALLYCISFPDTVSGQCNASKTLSLQGWHYSVSCLEEITPQPPSVLGAEHASLEFDYQEKYFPLSCITRGFDTYFAPSRWTKHKNKGDGGVDVTGAPNSVLVEGANSASVVLPSGSSAHYSIVIPATGYVTFDWSYIGGSNLLKKSFELAVNDQMISELSADETRSSFSSGLLQAGDEITLRAHSACDGFEIRLANFEFISNAVGIYERSWKVRSHIGQEADFLQFISVKKPDFTTLLFPSDYDGYHAPSLQPSDEYSPEITGFPVFDQDGLYSTTLDQLSLLKAGGVVLCKWNDEYLKEDGHCFIYRTWTVTDHCGSNIIEHTQLIKLNADCPETSPKQAGTKDGSYTSVNYSNNPYIQEGQMAIDTGSQLINSTLQPKELSSW